MGLEAHFETSHFKRLVPLMDALSETVSLDVCNEALALERNEKSNRAGRLLVLFDSSTNNTEKMAELVAEGCQLMDRMEVKIRSVPGSDNSYDADDSRTQHPHATFEDILWCDGIACGSPTNLGAISWRMKKFWDDFSQAGHWSVVDGKIGIHEHESDSYEFWFYRIWYH